MDDFSIFHFPFSIFRFPFSFVPSVQHASFSCLSKDRCPHPFSSYPGTWTACCTGASQGWKILSVAPQLLHQELIRRPLLTLNANAVLVKNLILLPKRPKATSSLCQASLLAQPCFSSSPLVALRLQIPLIPPSQTLGS